MSNRESKYILRLYVAGMTPVAERALKNIEKICETHLGSSYSIEVIDIVKEPDVAEQAQIFAVPTLVRQLPPPLRKIIGDLSNNEKVLIGLDIRPTDAR